MKLVIIGLMMMPLLTSCSMAVFDKAVVPSVVEYSAQQQIAAANELNACELPVVSEMIKDYHVMRNEARIARGDKVRFVK